MRQTVPRAVISSTTAWSGKVTEPYFVGPEEMTKVFAPTASRKLAREEVMLP